MSRRTNQIAKSLHYWPKKNPWKFSRKLTDKINNVAYLISHRTALLIVLTLIGLIHIQDVPMNSIYDHISNTPDLSG